MGKNRPHLHAEGQLIPFPVINGSTFGREFGCSDYTVFSSASQIISFYDLELVGPGKDCPETEQEKGGYHINAESNPFLFLNLHGNMTICSAVGCLSPRFLTALDSKF